MTVAETRSNRHEHSAESSPLTYADSVGNQVVRNLTPGSYRLTGPGLVIDISRHDVQKFLKNRTVRITRTGRYLIE